MLDTLSQPITLFWLLLLGLAGGGVFGILNFLKKILSHYIFRLSFDIIGCLVNGALFIYGITVFNSGDLRFFLILAYVLGVVVERKTAGILFAKLLDSVYNSVAKFWQGRPKTKLGKIAFKYELSK